MIIDTADWQRMNLRKYGGWLKSMQPIGIQHHQCEVMFAGDDADVLGLFLSEMYHLEVFKPLNKFLFTFKLRRSRAYESEFAPINNEMTITYVAKNQVEK